MVVLSISATDCLSAVIDDRSTEEEDAFAASSWHDGVSTSVVALECFDVVDVIDWTEEVDVIPEVFFLSAALIDRVLTGEVLVALCLSDVVDESVPDSLCFLFLVSTFGALLVVLEDLAVLEAVLEFFEVLGLLAIFEALERLLLVRALSRLPLRLNLLFFFRSPLLLLRLRDFFGGIIRT